MKIYQDSGNEMYFGASSEMSIEIDGSIHLNPEQNERDEQRTKIINSLGIIELRFSNEEVNNNSTFVIQSLRTSIAKLISNSTNPTREP